MNIIELETKLREVLTASEEGHYLVLGLKRLPAVEGGRVVAGGGGGEAGGQGQILR